MGRWAVDERFGVICKSCKQYFHLSKYQMGRSRIAGVPTFTTAEIGVDDWDGIAFPNRNLDTIQATCGWCDKKK
jgi:hypothetical protein